MLIPAVWGRSFDGLLADLDFAIWHANPTVWLERIQTPNLTEFLQIVYALFVPAVLLVPWCCGSSGRFKEFRYCAFLIALGFLVSYVGYLLVPARGPRFLLDPLQHHPLEGRWLFHWMRSTLDQTRIRALRLFSQRAYGAHHPGVVDAAVKSPNGWVGCISHTLCALFLLQFTFDTTIRSTWRRELWWRRC